MRLLGIDYGTKRVGIALSDEGARLAFPHVTISNDKKLLEEIIAIIDQYSVRKVVFGESKDYHMKDNRLMEDVRFFADELQQKTDATVVMHPEFMTSMQAEKTHFQLSEKNKKRGVEKGKNIDAQAAAIVLQSYIDSKR